MRRKLFSSLKCYQSVQRLQFSSNKSSKVLGYQTKPNEDEINADYIGKLTPEVCEQIIINFILQSSGPPDKISNIRPVLRYKPANETKLQHELRQKRAEAHEWVSSFWTKHNESFAREKSDFVLRNRRAGEDSVNADKMSEFYKAFLDKNWKNHFNFNLQWYKMNFNLLVLAFRVNIEQNVKKLTGTRK